MEAAEHPMPETLKALEEAMVKAASENRISCAAATALALKFSVSTRLVGETANRLRLKISKCQLGCF
jgi:hypothetical protein